MPQKLPAVLAEDLKGQDLCKVLSGQSTEAVMWKKSPRVPEPNLTTSKLKETHTGKPWEHSVLWETFYWEIQKQLGGRVI